MAFEIEDSPIPYSGKANFKGVNPNFMDNFQQMAQDYYAQTGKQLTVNDAWRSRETQAQAFKNKPGLAARPGHSLHETGMAMDIDETQANELAKMGLFDKYGFYRPMMTKAPGKKYEPWHIQMVENPQLEKRMGATAATAPQQGRFVIEDDQPQGGKFQMESPQTPSPTPTPQVPPGAGVQGQFQPGAPQDVPQEGTASNPAHGGIPGLLHKAFFGGSKEEAKKNIERWTGPEGIKNFNQDVTQALQSPEARAFSALDPMVALTTPVKATSPAVSPATKELSTLEKVVGVEKFDSKEMQQIMETAKGFGIDLTVPELTNSPTLRALWTRLAKTPGPQSEKLATYLEEIRNPQVESAIKNELGNISPSSLTPFQAGAQGRAAAKNIEERLKTARKTATQPLYRAAFESPKPIDTTQIIENLNQQIAKYPEGHPSRSALQQVEKMLTKDAETAAKEIVSEGGIAAPVSAKRVPIDDLETLHNTKTGIDQLLEKAKQDKSIDNDTRRLLMQVKSKLQGRMEADNPLYAQAQKTFRLLSKPLNDFRYGNPNIQPRDPHVKTMIAQLADLGDEVFEKAPGIIFGGNNPGKIARTKAYFDKAYPGTWDALVRTRLEEKLNKVSELVSGREGNIGGAFKRAVFPNQAERLKWQAALGEQKFKRLESFMDVLDKTRRIIYTNSETAFQIEAGKVLDQGGFEELIGNVASYTSPKGILGKAAGWIARRVDNLNKPVFAARLTDAMLDPQNAIELTRLRKMANTPRKAIETAQFLDTIIYKGENITGKSNE